MRLLFYVIIFFISFNVSFANDVSRIKQQTVTIKQNFECSIMVKHDNFNIYKDSIQYTDSAKKIRYFTLRRFTALALIVLTGPLGGHRLYLGTSPHVPVFYALTLGGGFFVLPAIDFVMILTTKDLSKFENNKNIIMWLNSPKQKSDYETENW